MKKENIKAKDAPTFGEYSKSHTVLPKKAFIIGSICAGVAVAGLGGTAIYLGVTRGSNVKDNSISFEEANEFARANYKFKDTDMESGKCNATGGAVLSWDFSATKNIDKTETYEDPGFYWKNMFWGTSGSGSVFSIVLDDEAFTALYNDRPVKKDNIKANYNNTCIYKAEEGGQTIHKTNPLYIVDYFTQTCGDGDDSEFVFFSSDGDSKLRKNGDEISMIRNVTIGKGTEEQMSNNVDITYNKNGTVKKVSMEIHGYMKRGDGGSYGLLKGTISAEFKYN